MKTYQDSPTYPLLRRNYSSYSELANVINRSASYVNSCLNRRRNFSDREKEMILADLGQPFMPPYIGRYFPEGRRSS